MTIISRLDHHNYLLPPGSTPVTIDCAFIPTRNIRRIDDGLLSALATATNNVNAILPVKYSNRFTLNPHISELFVEDTFISFYESLSHYKLIEHKYNLGNWQLPLKRSYALYRSVKEGHKNVLIIDDDMAFAVNTDILRISSLLSTCRCISCPSVDFPDMSSVDHIAVALGQEEHVFLSGACLFLRVNKSMPFFPQIYSEDWLFFLMMPPSELCCGGRLHQSRYDPFTAERVEFQELGDFLATSALKYGFASPQELVRLGFWKERKTERTVHLHKLAGLAKGHKQAQLFDSLLKIAIIELDKIDEHWCVEFIASLSEDRVMWDDLLKSC